MTFAETGLVRLEYSKILELEHLLKANKPLEVFAAEYGIHDIYSDSNLKQLQQTLYLGLQFQQGRGAYDAVDRNGIAWELKSLNIAGSKKEFTTCSRMSRAVLERYRHCRFAFSVYEHTALKKIYVMEASHLDPYFSRWEETLRQKAHINNPKIHLSYVKEFGKVVFDPEQTYWCDPVTVLAQSGTYLPQRAWLTPSERKKLNASNKKLSLCINR